VITPSFAELTDLIRLPWRFRRKTEPRQAVSS
jgi:hypothetical protein